MSLSYKASTLFSMKGRTAIVTGGGTGIGLMIAHGLAENGAKVYITGRRLEVLEKVSREWKSDAGQIIPLQMDVTDQKSITQAKETIESKEGKIHLLVNNAGQVGPMSRFFNNPDAPERKDAETLGNALFGGQTFEEWEKLYRINTFSIFFMTTAFLGLLAKGSQDVPTYTSSVINITSMSGVSKLAQEHFAYNNAKAATSHLTQLLSAEFALKNVPVRVNAIAPGVYASEMTFDTIKPEEVDEVGKGIQPVPARRAGSDEEMAGTALYLASPAGGYANGQEIVIDGGWTRVNPTA